MNWLSISRRHRVLKHPVDNVDKSILTQSYMQSSRSLDTFLLTQLETSDHPGLHDFCYPQRRAMLISKTPHICKALTAIAFAPSKFLFPPMKPAACTKTPPGTPDISSSFSSLNPLHASGKGFRLSNESLLTGTA